MIMRRLQQHFQGLHLISEGVELLLRLQGLHLGSKAGKGCKNIYIYWIGLGVCVLS